MKYLTPALALAALSIPVTAANAADYRVRLGLGVQIQPDYPGADSTEVAPFPEISVAKSGQPFGVGAPDDNLSIKLLSTGGFSAGPVASFRTARKDEDVGAPVGDVSRTFEAGVFAQQYFGESFRIRGEVRKGLGGHGGIVGNVGGDYIARDADNWTFSIGPRLRFGDDEYMDAYYGVSPAVAPLAGLPVYDPGGGIRSVGAVSGFTYSLGGPWGVYGYGRYDRLVGDAKDSPIVSRFGSPNQFSAGIGVSYVFNLSL